MMVTISMRMVMAMVMVMVTFAMMMIKTHLMLTGGNVKSLALKTC